MSGPSRKYLYGAVLTGNLASFTLGTVSTWSSPVIPKLNDPSFLDDNPLGRLTTEDEESWISSCMPLGGMLGCCLCGYAADKIGRKNTLLYLCGLPLFFSFLSLGFSNSIYLYYAFRFLGGVGCGGALTIFPIYFGEISEDSIRGGVTSSISFFLTIGQLFSYALGPFISILTFCSVLSSVAMLYIVLFFIIAPESPYYLIAIGQKDRAEDSLTKLRGELSPAQQKELDIMKNSAEENLKSCSSCGDFLTVPGTRKALITTLMLVIFQQLSGISIFLMYAQTIFTESGSSLPPELCSIALGCVQVVASFVTPLVVDKVGRKMMLIISALGLAVAEIPLGTYFYLNSHGYCVESIYWLPVVCLIVVMVSYNLGLGPIPWTVMSEIFPTNVKSLATTITATVAWFLCFLTTRFFKSIVEVLDMAGTLWLFAGCCFMSVIFVYTYVIETKGRSLVEIQELLRRR